MIDNNKDTVWQNGNLENYFSQMECYSRTKVTIWGKGIVQIGEDENQGKYSTKIRIFILKIVSSEKNLMNK